jgi:hypothetical protein
MNSWIITISLAGVMVIGFLTTPISCAREPQFKLPPIGQTITLMPISVGKAKDLRSPLKDFKAVHLTVGWGGRAIMSDRGDPHLLFYVEGQDEPVKDVAWAELETSYRSTGCSDDLIATLDGPLVGQALICDGSFGGFDQYSHIGAVNSKGRTRDATSWSTYKINDDVLGVIVNLY